MKLQIAFSLIILFFISCTGKSSVKKKAQDSTAVSTIKLNYDSCKKAVSTIKNNNKRNWNRLSAAGKEKIFTEAVTKTILPNWVGTPWSFNGTSETPQQGSIACGYFVTTVLRDAGVNLARVKLAQCASEQMIRTLIQPKYIQRFSNQPITNVIAAVQQQGYGLYIIGLDNHTGFIYNDGNDVYFIHSTYVGTKDVQYEKAATSKVLQWSKYKVIGKLSEDEKVLQNWMN